VLAFVPALAGFVSIEVFEVGNNRSSGLVASVGITFGLLAVLVFLRKPWRGSTLLSRWLGSLLVVLLGFVSLAGLAGGVPEFLQARGLFVDLDSYGPRAVVATNGVFVVVADEQQGGVVWYSEDGVDWSRVPDDPIFDDLEMADAIDVEGRIVAIGAPSDTGEALVLTSSDGRVWELTGRFENEEFGTSPHAIAQSSDGVVAITSTIFNDVEFFTSAHLAIWAAVEPRPVLDDGEEGVDVACNPESCVAVGNHIATYRLGLDVDTGVVWTSTSGDRWELISHDFDTALFTAVGANSNGFLIVGNDREERGVVWASPDGRQWNKVPATDFDEFTLDGATGVDSGWVIFGTDQTTNSILVWTSPDANRWQTTVIDNTLPRGSRIRAVSTSLGTWVAAGIDTTEGTAVVWTSTDSENWDRLPLP
jgi:hypothetical protein